MREARTRVLLAVDGNSLAHRAFHAYEKAGLTARDGRPIGAVYGFLALMCGIVEKVAGRHGGPDGIIVGFDDPDASHRKDAYPAYKATRERKDDSLYAQMDELRALLPRLGVRVEIAAGWEADDVVASAAARAEREAWRCVIATSDRDSFQLISEHTEVLRLVSGLDNAIWLDPAGLVAKYGIAPERYVEYAAVRGDSSDNLPGVAGVGEKRAAALCGAFGSLDDAFGDHTALMKVLGQKAARSFVASEEAVRRNLELMAARRDLTVDLEGAKPSVPAHEIAEVIGEIGLRSLVSRVAVAFAGIEDSPALDEPDDAYFTDEEMDPFVFDSGILDSEHVDMERHDRERHDEPVPARRRQVEPAGWTPPEMAAQVASEAQPALF